MVHPTDTQSAGGVEVADGKNWTRTVEVALWVHGDLPATMAFAGRMWLMGGRRLPSAENSNKDWRRWTLAAGDHPVQRCVVLERWRQLDIGGRGGNVETANVVLAGRLS